MATEDGLSGLSYDQILNLPLDEVINPAYDPEHRVTIGEVRAAACINILEEIPEDVIAYLKKTNYFGEDPADYARQWNADLKLSKKLAEAIKVMASGSMIKMLSMCDLGTYSEIKEFQVLAGITTLVARRALDR